PPPPLHLSGGRSGGQHVSERGGQTGPPHRGIDAAPATAGPPRPRTGLHPAPGRCRRGRRLAGGGGTGLSPAPSASAAVGRRRGVRRSGVHRSPPPLHAVDVPRLFHTPRRPF